MSQEFRLSVTLFEDDECFVRTEKVASGVPLGEERVRWPIDQWLALSAELMNDPLMGLLQGKTSRVLSPSAKNPVPNLVALGQQLHSGLFQGRLRDSWTCAQGIAQHRREVLQLRVGIKDRRLSRLPWEVLHADDRPLATGTDVVFSRYHTDTNLLKPTHIIPHSGPLRILMAIASPSDRDSLQLKREVLHLQEELQNRTVNPLKQNLHAPEIQLTILEQPDREQLTQALEQGHYQVLHYAGHSNLGSRGGELYLVSSRTGLTETLSGDDLAGLLVNNGIQMAVFNSCRGAYSNASKQGEDSPERNLTEALVKRGIPAVLAMAESIPDDVALTLTRLFYRNLNQGYPVDLSLSRARAGLITAYGSHQLYWALPILYQHPEFNGYLTGTPTQPGTGDSLQPKKSLASETQPLLAGAKSKTWNSANVEEEADCADGQVRSHFPDKLGFPMNGLEPNSALSTLNARSPLPAVTPPISTPGSSLATTQQSRTPVATVKPIKKLGWKKYLTVTFCALPLALGAGFLGWRQLQNSNSKPEELLPTVRTPISQGYLQIQRVNLEQTQTAKVMAMALNNFQAGETWAGLKATEALLDRVALPQAEGALQAVPKFALDQPEVNFLKGRLAWQFQQIGNKKYSVDDARRSWEIALKARPHSLKYRNALGFAYYAEGNFERAYQVWASVLNSIAPIPNKPTTSVSVQAGNDILTAIAGLGMVMAKPIPNLTPQQQAARLTKAIEFRQQVIASDPLSFGPDALAKNWLWSEAAIRDWQSLQKLQKAR